MCKCNTEGNKCCRNSADCSCKDDTPTLSIKLSNVSIEQYSLLERASELLEMTLEEYVLAAVTMEAINTISMDKAHKQSQQ